MVRPVGVYVGYRMEIRALKRARNAWSMIDQAWVSGINFLIGIALARALGLENYGVYAVAQTYLLYANTFQASLVVAPMMTAVPIAADAASQRRLLSGYFGYMLVVLAVTVALVLIAAWLLGGWSEAIGLHGLAWPLAAAMVSFQTQDWLRRASFARERLGTVVLGDVLAYGGQLLCLLVLATYGSLTPAAALWALAGAFGVSALVTTVNSRLVPSLLQMLIVVRAEWRSSLNYWASWQLQWVSASGVVLVGASLIGVQAAGAIRAVQNLTGLISVFFQWMDNVMPVKCATRLRTGGVTALLDLLGRLHVLGALALSIIGVLLSVFAGPLLGWVYGEAFVPFALLVALQAAYYVAQHSYRMESYLRRTLAQSHLLARASLVQAIVSVGSAAALVPALAERGILGGMLLGQLAALAYLRWLRNSDHTLSSVVARPSHFVLGHRAGRGTLVLPVANRHVLRSALDMYYPSRWTGRTYQRMLALVLPPMLRLGFPVLAKTTGDWCAAFAQVSASIPGAREVFVGGLVGEGRPRAKTTLKFMTERGQALAYGRVATLPEAVDLVRQEASVLARLQQVAVRDQVPDLIAHGQLVDSTGYFLVEEAGPERPSGASLDARHFEFLLALVQVEQRQTWGNVLGELESDSRLLVEQAMAYREVTAGLVYLSHLNADALPVCIEHGDFAPWNIREQRCGRLFVFDWEHSRPKGTPWLDALHFQFQLAVMVERLPPNRTVTELLALFKLPAARAYRDAVAIPGNLDVALVVLYLLKSLFSGAREFAPLQASEQVTRRQALSHLAEVGFHG